MNPVVRIVLDIILVASIGLAGISAYKLVEGYMGYHQAQEAYKNLRQTASDKDTNTDSDPGKNIDWEALQKVNVNVGAWIRAEGTTIDYPVTYAWDNEYFLKHLLDGSYNDAGTIFVDCENSQDFVDKNTVLYGHHMLEDPLMFAEIYEYTDQAFYDSHKVIEIYTPTAKYEVYPVAGFETTGTDGYIRIEFADDDDFMSYVDECRERSTFQSDVKISKEDQTVMLSTCSYVVSDGRYALLGKLVKVKDYEKSE
jgi:sortase B